MFKYRNSLALRSLVWCLALASVPMVLAPGKPKPPPPPPLPAVQYQLIDIGSGGYVHTPASFTGAAINASGVTIANADHVWAKAPNYSWAFATSPFLIEPQMDTSGRMRWFVDADGDGENDLITYLPAPTDAFAVEAMCINDAGVIAGIAWFWDGVEFPRGYPVCWIDGQGYLFDLGADCIEVVALNSNDQMLVSTDLGQLLCDLDVADGTVAPAVAANLGNDIEATAMNDFGDVVGHDYDTGHAFILRNAGTNYAQLISLPAGDGSSAGDINNNAIRTVVGSAGHYNYTKPCMWQVATNGAVTTTELTGLPGIDGKYTSYMPSSINDQDQFVGEYQYYAGNKQIYKGFFWQKGTMLDLLSLLVNSPSNVARITPSGGINNNGLIAGWYQRSDGVWRNCVLVPVIK